MGLAFTVPDRMTAPRMTVWPLAVGGTASPSGCVYRFVRKYADSFSR